MKLFVVASVTLSTILSIAAVSARAGDERYTQQTTQIEVKVDERKDDCDFAILEEIDTSPVYALERAQSGATAKGSSKARSLVNFMFDTRGSDWSKEGADIAVHGKSEITSDSTSLYRDQMHRDELHWRVSSLIAMIASALGKNESGSDAASQPAVNYVAELRSLIGDAETDAVMKWLTGSDIDRVKTEIPGTEKLDLPKILEAQDIMLEAALNKDLVMASVKKELLPYANKGKGKRIATKVAYSTLGMAAFVPNWIAPVAEATFLGTMMANGGPEQDKLLKELYLAKRIGKRTELLQRELNLALNSRAISLATCNGPLYKFAREFTEYLCGEEMESRLFPQEISRLGQNKSTVRTAF